MSISKTVVQQNPWILDTTGIDTAGSALGTDKSAATVHALDDIKRISLQGPYSLTVALEFRVRANGSDGDSNVFNLYAMADPHGKGDHYTLVGTLTFTAGTQVDSNSYLFADTVSISDELWIDDVVTLSDASDGIARVALNTQGYSDFVLIATTLGSTAVYIDYRRI